MQNLNSNIPTSYIDTEIDLVKIYKHKCTEDVLFIETYLYKDIEKLKDEWFATPHEYIFYLLLHVLLEDLIYRFLLKKVDDEIIKYCYSCYDSGRLDLESIESVIKDGEYETLFAEQQYAVLLLLNDYEIRRLIDWILPEADNKTFKSVYRTFCERDKNEFNNSIEQLSYGASRASKIMQAMCFLSKHVADKMYADNYYAIINKLENFESLYANSKIEDRSYPDDYKFQLNMRLRHGIDYGVDSLQPVIKDIIIKYPPMSRPMVIPPSTFTKEDTIDASIKYRTFLLMSYIANKTSTHDQSKVVLHFDVSPELVGHSRFVDNLLLELKAESSPNNTVVKWVYNDVTSNDLKYVLGLIATCPNDFKKIKWTFAENRGPSKPRLFQLLYALGYERYVNLSADTAWNSSVYKTFNSCFEFYNVKTKEFAGEVKSNSFTKPCDYSPDLMTIKLVESAIEKYEKDCGDDMTLLKSRLRKLDPTNHIK